MAYKIISNRLTQTTAVVMCCLGSSNAVNGQTLVPDETLTEIVTIGEWGDARDNTQVSVETERLLGVAGAVEDPLQAVFSMPGVTFSDDGEPVIRGSGPGDNAFYIDMVPARNLYHVWGNSIFNKYVIRDFELHPAAFSSQYGNATGGVIDVRLRDPKNVPFETTASLSFLQAAVLMESRISDNQAFYVSARQSMLDKIAKEEDLTEENDGVIIEDSPSSSDYQAKYVWEVNDRNRLSFTAAGSSDDAGARLTDNNNDVLVDPDLAGAIDYSESFDSQGLNWKWKSATGLSSFSLLATNMTEESDFFYGGNQYLKTDVDRTSVRGDYSVSLLNSHTIKAGLIYEDNAYDIDANQKFVSCSDFDANCSTTDVTIQRYVNQVEVTRLTAYVEDLFKLSDKQELTFGLHYSSDDYLDDTQIEPRIRWNYQVDDQWSTYIALGQYSQLPDLEYIAPDIGNPNLETIKANHFVWGIGQSLGHGWSWKTDLYYKDISDLVISVTDPLHPDFDKNYTNRASGKAYGVELMVNKDRVGKWDGWVALSLGKAERTDLINNETIPFDYDRPVMFDLVANYHLSDRWSFGVKWKFQTGDRYTPIVDVARNSLNSRVLEPIYGQRNSETTPDYHRLDFRVQYKKEKAWGYWSVYADIINLYGRENVSGYDFAPNGVDVLNQPPAGFGSNVPVSTSVSQGAIPSIGVEVHF